MKYWLLFALGLLIDAFVHLIIPICVAKGKKPRLTITIWLIAIGSGLLGFITFTIILPAFNFVVGAANSALFTVIGYFILKIRCSKKEE